MKKAYMITALDDYVVGYALATNRNIAKLLAIRKGITDGYEYIDMRTKRCYSLDDMDCDFIDVADLTDLQMLMLVERYLKNPSNDYFYSADYRKA